MILFITFAVWVFLIAFSKPNTIINNKYTSYFVMICFIGTIGYRISILDSASTVDLYIYLREFNLYQNLGYIDAINGSNKEFLFTSLQWLLGQLFKSESAFKLGIWLFFSFIFIWGLRRIFLPWQVLIVFFSYLTYFIFFNYILNTMRQGLAISILIFAISLMVSEKKKTKTFLVAIVIAPLFHMTTLPLSIGLLLLNVFRFKIKTLLITWITFLTLFLSGLNKVIFSRLNISELESYSSEATLIQYSGASNRIDFLLFGLFGIVLGWLLMKYTSDKSNATMLLYKSYILFNIYYLAIGFIAYSDRVASYSWFLLPLIIWRPIFNSKKNTRILTLVTLTIFTIISIYTGSLGLLFK